MFEIIWKSVLIGVGGTAAMDLWALLLNVTAGEKLPNWGLVGRWFSHVGRGQIFHEDIATAPQVPNETAIGWLAHYVVGILYGFVLVLAAGTEWLARPTFLPAFVLGMVTIAAGWFLLQPGMGAGWAASRRPNPWKVRALNVLAHFAFSIGLFVTALIVSRILAA